MARDWREGDHPRWPRGTSGRDRRPGRFRPKAGSWASQVAASLPGPAAGYFDPADDPRALRSVQVGIGGPDGEDINDEADARAAMSQAIGMEYRGGLEKVDDGLWLVDLPGEAGDDLIEGGFWGRENDGGFSVEAEWPSGGEDPRGGEDLLRAHLESNRRQSSMREAFLGEEAEREEKQQAWLEDVRSQITEIGFDPDEVEAAWGGPFVDEYDDPEAGFVESAIDQFMYPETDAGSVDQPGRLTNRDVADALAPRRRRGGTR